MDEFGLIERIVMELGERAAGEWVTVGPGDDSSIMHPSPGCDLVSSIDALVEGVHFPAGAPPELVGYRAFMVSMSDVAAMAAEPRFALVALTLAPNDQEWAVGLAAGMRSAAAQCGAYICGGNLARGARGITVSVHGEVPAGKGLLRQGARVGDGVFVSGPIGAAAACVRLSKLSVDEHLTEMQSAYYKPRARLDLAAVIRGVATAGIDISDGLLQDLDHLLTASGVGAHLVSKRIPLGSGAVLDDALFGGDDYELLCTGADLPGFVKIGEIVEGAGIVIDGAEVEPHGFNHFRA